MGTGTGEAQRRQGGCDHEGRVDVTMFPGNSLVKNQASYESVKYGVCDMMETWTPFYPDKFLFAEIFHLPLITGSPATASQAAWTMLEAYPDIGNAEFETHILARHTNAGFGLHTIDKLIKTIEDLDGMLIGADTKQQSDWLAAMGASPVSVIMPDSYLAFSKGEIEGGVYPWAPLRSAGLCEFLNYHTVVGWGFATATLHMNNEKWQSLPSDIQDIISEIGGMNFSAMAGYGLSNGMEVDMQWMREKGDEFYHLTPEELVRWRAILGTSYDEWQPMPMQ